MNFDDARVVAFVRYLLLQLVERQRLESHRVHKLFSFLELQLILFNVLVSNCALSEEFVERPDFWLALLPPKRPLFVPNRL